MRHLHMTLTLLFLAVLPSFANAQESPAPRPNIVVFLSDDMGWGQLGYQGGTAVATPNIDRLAKEGVQLSQFYVCSTCTPTRSSLLTGRYPFRTGTEERVHGNDTAGMLTDERTLAQALGEAGYATAILGKWHLGEWHKQHLPMQRGFDYQFGFYGALIDSFLKMRGGVYDWHRNEQPATEAGYSTFQIADEFESVLAKRDTGKPFFYYVPFNAVHGPTDAPPEFVAKNKRNTQLAMLECMDVAIGRMLAALQQQNVLDDTLVIFFNDNGATQRVKNLPYRGGKKETFEGGVRVACAMRWPGKLPAGAVRDQLLHVTDFYPTLVQLAGGSLAQPLPLDGLNIWPILATDAASPRHEVVYSLPELAEAETGQPAIRIDDYKLVEDALFNIENDPYEKDDIAAQHPQIVKQLRDRMAEHVAQRRQPETHGKVPGNRPWIRGEAENSEPAPAWYLEIPFDQDKTLKEGPGRAERNERQAERAKRQTTKQ